MQILLAAGKKPFTEKGFSNYIVKAARAAGLPIGCSAHGLRKATATRLAEFSCTEHEIMAITGHKTLAEVQRYTRAARLHGLADGAMEKYAAGVARRRDKDVCSTDIEELRAEERQASSVGDAGNPSDGLPE